MTQGGLPTCVHPAIVIWCSGLPKLRKVVLLNSDAAANGSATIALLCGNFNSAAERDARLVGTDAAQGVTERYTNRVAIGRLWATRPSPDST